jgi:hypothetical protein
MKIFTTINPKNNFEAQNEAIQSWLKKYQVVSINTKEEINKIKNKYPGVSFVPTTDTYEYNNKKLIKIDSILLEMSKVNGYSCFLNSDIILKDGMDIEINQRHLNNGIYLSTRYDVDEENNLSKFVWGFDFFCIHSKYSKHFRNEIFTIGLPWWDYWIPICAYMKGFNLYHIDYELFYHKKHKLNYDMKKWYSLGQELYEHLKPFIEEDFKLSDFMVGENGIMLIKKFIDSKLINIKQSNTINL